MRKMNLIVASTIGRLSITRYLPILALWLAPGIPAHAIGIVGFGWAYSAGDKIADAVGLPGPSYVSGWGWVLDPSANVLRGQVTFSYDPSVMAIVPQNSGFIGVFSNDPSTAIPLNSTDPSPLNLGHMPGPRPGMTWSLDVGVDTVTLSFDTSANPVSIDEATGSVNFFILAAATKANVVGWRLDTSGFGQFRELGSATDQSQTYAVCSSPPLGQYYCGDPSADTYANYGFTAIMAPEPSAAMLGLTGVLGLAGCVSRRRRLRGIRRLA